MEDFFVTNLDEIRKEQERKLEELSKNPPSDIRFTYSKEELDKIITDIRKSWKEIELKAATSKKDNGYGRTIEDYADGWNDYYEPKPDEIVDLIEQYNKLVDKNNIRNVEYIVSQINQKYNNRMLLPNEITKTIEEIKGHLNWLYQVRDINQYLNNKQAEQQRSQQMQYEQQKQREQEIQQERYRTIQNEFPLINEKINYIRELHKNNELFKIKETELLKERLYFYQKINPTAEDMLNGRRKEITQEDMDRLSSFLRTLDSIQKEIIDSHKQPQQTTPVQEETYDNIKWNNISSEQAEIEQLKEQIGKYNSQINTLLASMQPYMQIPKVNQEISKVIDKNNEINSLQIIDSLNDYKTIVKTKQSLTSYLEKANKFIKDSVGKQQEPVAQQQTAPVQEETYNNIQWNNISSEQAEIEQLKEQIGKYNSQINTLLASMQPYMQIPKVNQEISKVIDKNNEINSLQIIDSLNDYKTIVKIKQSLTSYLEKANKFIKDNVGKQQEPVAQQQTTSVTTR